MMPIGKVEILKYGKSVKLFLKNVQPVDVMTISYDISNTNEISLKGTVQSRYTIYQMINSSKV